MPIQQYKLGAETSKTVEGTVVASTYKENEYNKNAGKWEEVEKNTSIGEGNKGGSVFGYNIEAKEASEFTLYDSAKEEEKNKIIGPINFKEKETKQVFFPFAFPFKNGVYCQVASGKLSGEIYCDIE